MTPSLGSGSTLRAYPTRRFRGEDTLLLQAEWRIMINRFMDTAIFYDAGKAVQDEGDLDLDNLKSDVGFGFRLHAPFRTLLRTDVAKGSEGYQFVMSVQPVF
jgi:outer membrane protein insertion porin family